VVKFQAVLKQSGMAIKISSEGNAEIILEASADQLAEVLKLNLFSKQSFTVMFFARDEKEEEYKQ